MGGATSHLETKRPPKVVQGREGGFAPFLKGSGNLVSAAASQVLDEQQISRASVRIALDPVAGTGCMLVRHGKSRTLPPHAKSAGKAVQASSPFKHPSDQAPDSLSRGST